MAQAARLARRSRVAVVAVAPSMASGEFQDRACLALDCPPAAAHQDALVRAVAKANPRTVVVRAVAGAGADALGPERPGDPGGLVAG